VASYTIGGAVVAGERAEQEAVRTILVGTKTIRDEHCLWRTVHEVCGITREEYRDRFDRRAGNSVAALKETPPSRGTVVVLGREIAEAFDLPDVGWIIPLVRDGVAWRQVPHPSGRNPWYFVLEHRLVVGLLLEELMQHD
jgi:hypothetical protein